MKRSFLKLVKCIFCEGSLELLNSTHASDIEIEWGTIKCTSCKKKYPIVSGIPVLMDPEAHLDVKMHKIEDNIVKKGPKVKDLVSQIEKGQIEKIEFSLLTPRLNRTTYKKAPKDAPVTNKIARKLPKGLSKRINWNIYYYLKFLLAKISLEDQRKSKQELKIFHKLKKETKGLGFLRHYFLQNSNMNEYFYYYAYRFSQPRYLVGMSLINLFLNSQKPILDLACGAGHFMHYLTNTRENQKCVGIDRDFVSLYIAKKFIAPKGEYICAEADKPLPFEDDCFSGVLCSDAFQYFTNRSSSVKEMQRIVSKEGVIVLTKIDNPLVSNSEEPEQITPSELKELFSDMPNSVVGEEIILNRYVKKLGPNLSKENEIEELNKMEFLSLIASFQNDVFQDQGSFDTWPHSIGRLQLNPLYKEYSRDESGSIHYNYVFPSEIYEYENKGWLEYASDKLTLSEKDLEALSKQSRTPEVNKLIEDFIVFGTPDNYEYGQVGFF